MDFNIGSKIKALRKARKLTLQDVARETGFSPALISQIENNNVSPPIATLSKIARFFDVRMGHFFEIEEIERKYEVVRRGERRVVSRVISKAGTGHGYTYEALSFRKRNKKMEPFVLTVSERAAEETLYNHEGEEFLLILKGRAEVILEDQRLLLEEGDAIYFDSALKHRLLSYDGQEVQVLAVVTR
ncbi:MAG: helix-turn-helix transcriptional regulator [Desulfuromonadales bacterium]|nr:helix-turn-helix transcriptional regulator [Desulfuromonadales bacterium]